MTEKKQNHSDKILYQTEDGQARVQCRFVNSNAHWTVIP